MVKQTINPVAYRLDLPPSVRIHDVFHVSLLRPYLDNGRTPLPPPPEIVDGALEFEVESILLHKEVKNGRRRLPAFVLLLIALERSRSRVRLVGA